MRNQNKRRFFAPTFSMERNELKLGEEFDDSCIFCLVANNTDKETKVIKQDEELVCFRDICPAAPHHYLVIPREHIKNCRSLNRRNIDFVERMVTFGKEVLRDLGIIDMKDVRLGFHKPPFISVEHLHLHVLAPASKISDCMLYKFTPETDRFIIEESLRKILEKVSPPVFSNGPIL